MSNKIEECTSFTCSQKEDKKFKGRKINLNFAILKFIQNCERVSQSGTNAMFKSKDGKIGKYSKLSDINTIIKRASQLTSNQFDNDVIVYIKTDSIVPKQTTCGKDRYSIEITLSVVAEHANLDFIPSAKHTMTLEYAECFSVKDGTSSNSASQTYAAAVTYIEKKAKQCILHLIDESEEDLDNERFNKREIEKELPNKIEGI